MSRRAALTSFAVLVLAVGTLAGPAVADAQTSTQPVQLTLDFRGLGGRRIHSALPGQRFTIGGTMTPSRKGEPVEIDVQRDGRPILKRVATVRQVTAAGVGTFTVSARFKRPGDLQVDATHEPSAASGLGAGALRGVPFAVQAAGHRRPGCQSAARVVGNRDHAARFGPSRLSRGVLLDTGAAVHVPRSAGGRLLLERGRAVYRVDHGEVHIECNDVFVPKGWIFVRTDRHGHGYARIPGIQVLVDRRSRALAATSPGQVRFSAGQGRVWSTSHPGSLVRTVGGDIVLVDHGLPRMSTWPFARSPDQRSARRSDHLPAFWADGLPCSVGCRPAGVQPGWPLKPFHEQHPLRAGLNEIRTANMHIGIDIQAYSNQKVYAIQSGRVASISDRGSSEVHIRVGAYEYWHVIPSVYVGQYVRAYHTVLGRIWGGARHVHLSELRGGRYLNPLRPGGIALKPWKDTEPPIVGSVYHSAVEVFDPQSFRRTTNYRTPVLAPAAVAWRARDSSGRAITPLHFAYRGSQHYGSKYVYAPGTTNSASPDGTIVGWPCWANWTICIPHWRYRLPGIPASAAGVTVYAYDWAGNVSVRTSELAPHS